MATPKSLDQVRAARQKRQGVFEKARAMRQAGQISEADFALLEKKFQQKMAALDAAEAEILAAEGAPEPELEESSAEEVLGLARNILGSGEAPAPEPEPASIASAEPEPDLAPALDPLPEVADLAAAAAAATDPGDDALDQALAGEPTPVASAADEPELDPDLVATLPDLGRLSLGAASEDDSADETDPEGHPPLEGPLPEPDVAVDELSAMLRDAAELGEEPEDDATPVMTFPAVDGAASLLGPSKPTGSGDSDLLSLVRGSFSTDQDSRPDIESRLRAEQRARDEAVARAKAKEEETAEMHEAFQRTVKEKDSAAAKLQVARREVEKFRKAAYGGLAGLALFMGVCLMLGRARTAALKQVQDAEANLATARRQGVSFEDKWKKAERDAGKYRRDLDTLSSQVRGKIQTLETKLAASEGRVAELEEQLAGVPAGGAASGLVPDARLDAVLLELLHQRVRRPGSDEEEFLESVRETVPAARTGVEELARRRQVDGGMLDDPLVDALELALAGNLRAAAVPIQALLTRQEREAAGTRRALAAVRLELGDGAGAAALLEGVRGDGEEALEARRLLAAAYRRARRFDDARRVLQQVMASPLATHDDFLQAGMVAEMTEDVAAAEAAYRHVVDRDPDNARAISLLSSLAIQRADWAAAAALLERAVDANPKDDALRFNLALARIGLGETEAATPLVEELLRRRWPGSEDLAGKLGLDPSAYAPAPAPEAPGAGGEDLGLDGPGGSGLPGGSGGDLPGGDLPGGDLPGGDLSGGDLPGGDLPGGDLPGGDLPGMGGDLPGMDGAPGGDDDLPGFGG